jgi:hypothetical protein
MKRACRSEGGERTLPQYAIQKSRDRDGKQLRRNEQDRDGRQWRRNEQDRPSHEVYELQQCDYERG